MEPSGVELPSSIAIRVDAVTKDLDVQGDEEGGERSVEEGEVGSYGAGSRWSKPKELFVKMSSVVIAQFGQILLGPALTVRDNEPVNKTLFNKFNP